MSLNENVYQKDLVQQQKIYHSGGSRIWQGRVSNPSERGTGEGEAPDMRAEARAGGGLGVSPRKCQNLNSLLHFRGI